MVVLPGGTGPRVVGIDQGPLPLHPRVVPILHKPVTENTCPPHFVTTLHMTHLWCDHVFCVCEELPHLCRVVAFVHPSASRVSVTNCVAAVYPELVPYWHPTFNGALCLVDGASATTTVLCGLLCRRGSLVRALIDGMVN